MAVNVLILNFNTSGCLKSHSYFILLKRILHYFATFSSNGKSGDPVTTKRKKALQMTSHDTRASYFPFSFFHRRDLAIFPARTTVLIPREIEETSGKSIG